MMYHLNDKGNCLRAKECVEFLGIKRTTFYRWVKEGKIPAGLHLSPRCTVWRKGQLEEFLEKAVDGQGGSHA